MTPCAPSRVFLLNAFIVNASHISLNRKYFRIYSARSSEYAVRHTFNSYSHEKRLVGGGSENHATIRIETLCAFHS